MYIYVNMSLHSSQNENICQVEVVERIRTHILCVITIFLFSKIVLFMRSFGKIWLEPDRPQMTI
jgi:Na+/H+ antiporter NhaC